ncbi:hypothetical protein EDD22DRAFT_957524 [Suillus occidentalis]|nr:hypothetical protein EDD22DRAFT_957524 [Suillus occidentalis]
METGNMELPILPPVGREVPIPSIGLPSTPTTTSLVSHPLMPSHVDPAAPLTPASQPAPVPPMPPTPTPLASHPPTPSHAYPAAPLIPASQPAPSIPVSHPPTCPTPSPVVSHHPTPSYADPAAPLTSASQAAPVIPASHPHTPPTPSPRASQPPTPYPAAPPTPDQPIRRTGRARPSVPFNRRELDNGIGGNLNRVSKRKGEDVILRGSKKSKMTSS